MAGGVGGGTAREDRADCRWATVDWEEGRQERQAAVEMAGVMAVVVRARGVEATVQAVVARAAAAVVKAWGAGMPETETGTSASSLGGDPWCPGRGSYKS